MLNDLLSKYTASVVDTLDRLVPEFVKQYFPIRTDSLTAFYDTVREKGPVRKKVPLREGGPVREIGALASAYPYARKIEYANGNGAKKRTDTIFVNRFVSSTASGRPIIFEQEYCDRDDRWSLFKEQHPENPQKALDDKLKMYAHSAFETIREKAPNVVKTIYMPLYRPKKRRK